MKLRVLTAAAVAAWSKTAAATTASVLPGVLDHPAGASVSSTAAAATPCGLVMVAPSLSGVPQPGIPVNVSAGYHDANAGCFPGQLSLQASQDQTQWKTLASQHDDTMVPAGVISAPCLTPGTWWYQARYVTDDNTFQKSTSPVQFTC
jgi:hypothetical protein